MQRRFLGMVLLVLGLWLAKWQIYEPLHASELGIREHTTSSTAIGLGLLLPLVGAGYVVFGSAFDKVMAHLKVDKDNLNAKNVISIVVFAIIFISVFVFVESKLDEQGFSKRSHYSRPNHYISRTQPLRCWSGYPER
jgi:hypothetical protein